jgi:hypothetical protein
MRNPLLSLALAAISGIVGTQVSNSAEQSAASVRVQSVHLIRPSSDFNKRFGGRYYSYGDSTPSVSLQLLMTLNDAVMLPVGREAVTIETFVDDTYQNLLGGSSDYRYNSVQPAVSEDGHDVIFSVAGSRSLADDASRVFVRGFIQARVSRGEPVTRSSQFSLNVGQKAAVGDFQTTISSLSDRGASGGYMLSLSIEGDAARIQRIRAVDSSGKVLSDDHQSRVTASGLAGNASTAMLYLRSSPPEPLSIEFTYVDKADPVRIPFEAQVDIGGAKAGPFEDGEAQPVRKAATRPWPPPREQVKESLPPRREPFTPTAKGAASAAGPAVTPEQAAVDLFSLTVSRPGPSESARSVWKAPPSPAFYASGFTIARLMLSMQEASIISIPADGISISRFEDDKGGKLDTTLYVDSSTVSYASFPSNIRSTDGRQMLLTVSLAAAPTAGATRCTLVGDIHAKVGRGASTNVTDYMDLRKGESFKIGAFTMRLDTIRQSAVLQPGNNTVGLEVWLSISGPIYKLRSIEILERDSHVLGSAYMMPDDSRSGADQQVTKAILLYAPLRGQAKVRVCQFESDEQVRVPFEITTGIGL